MPSGRHGPTLAGVAQPAARAEAAPLGRLIWTLGLGSLGLAWSVTTVAAYLPPVIQGFTSSTTLVGLVLASEGVFAILLPLFVGPLSDATGTPFGRRRPYLAFAVGPMSVALALLAFMPSLWSTTFLLFAFFFAYYIYEPPYRGLYPDLLPEEVYGRAQGAQHVVRGVAIGGVLVGGGILLGVWEPFPFVLAAGVTALTCSLVVALVHEDYQLRTAPSRFRSHLATPWRIVRRERSVRRFLIANTAWEATFAGMRTFVVLYIIQGLDQPLYVSSTVLAVVAAGYVAAAAFSGRLGDQFGLGRVIVGASVVYGLGLLAGLFAQRWHWWYYGLIAPVAVAGGTVMTLAWGLLFKLMPESGRGATAGLAIMTKGIGLLVGPLFVGAAIDIFSPFLDATDGYAAMWPAVALPILVAIPLAVMLAHEEARGSRRKGSRPAS